MFTALAARKRELAIIVVTTIIAAFSINILSNIIVNDFYEEYRMELLIGSILILLSSSFFVVLLVFRYSRSGTVEISFPLSFDRKRMSFRDLPYCSPSVHARFQFDNLPDEGKRHLILYDKPLKFWDSEFSRFIDNVIQEWLLGVVFNNKFSDQDLLEKRDFSELPNGIRENKLFRSWFGDKQKVFLRVPHGAKIECHGRHNSFVTIKSFYGEAAFTWNVSFHQMPSFSGPFIDRESTDIECHDFLVALKMNYSCNFIPFLSKRLMGFSAWLEKMAQNLNDFDWEKRQLDRIVFMIGNKGKYTDT